MAQNAKLPPMKPMSIKSPVVKGGGYPGVPKSK